MKIVSYCLLSFSKQEIQINSFKNLKETVEHIGKYADSPCCKMSRLIPLIIFAQSTELETYLLAPQNFTY